MYRSVDIYDLSVKEEEQVDKIYEISVSFENNEDPSSRLLIIYLLVFSYNYSYFSLMFFYNKSIIQKYGFFDIIEEKYEFTILNKRQLKRQFFMSEQLYIYKVRILSR